MSEQSVVSEQSVSEQSVGTDGWNRAIVSKQSVVSEQRVVSEQSGRVSAGARHCLSGRRSRGWDCGSGSVRIAGRERRSEMQAGRSKNRPFVQAGRRDGIAESETRFFHFREL